MKQKIHINLKNIIIQQINYDPKDSIVFHDQVQVKNETIIWNDNFEENSLFIFVDLSDYQEIGFSETVCRDKLSQSKYSSYYSDMNLNYFNKYKIKHDIYDDVDIFCEEDVSEEEEEESNENEELNEQDSAFYSNMEINEESINVSLTDEENQIIERLQAIHQNFERLYIIQVFIACDRNESQTNECLISMN